MIAFVRCRHLRKTNALLQKITYGVARGYIQKETPDPLRILFCGSDEFSAVSLRRLHEEQQRNKDLIASIDVLCKTGKPSGRGLKTARDVPVKAVGQALGLQVLEIPTFRGWSPPTRDDRPINLVIAVSFGLLIPPRILNLVKYGGLNVHPSLLPALSGPAPLHHTLMRGMKHSGVTVQTLHPEHFDRGTILAQRKCQLESEHLESFTSLRDYMAPLSAELLIRCLRDKLFVPPLNPLPPDMLEAPSYAPKITPEDARIDWVNWDAARILRIQRAIGPLWNAWMQDPIQANPNVHGIGLKAPIDERIQWHGLSIVGRATGEVSLSHLGLPSIYTRIAKGRSKIDTVLRNVGSDSNLPFLQLASSEDSIFPDDAVIGGMWTRDGYFLAPENMVVSGLQKEAWHKNPGGAVRFLLDHQRRQRNPTILMRLL